MKTSGRGQSIAYSEVGSMAGKKLFRCCLVHAERYVDRCHFISLGDRMRNERVCVRVRVCACVCVCAYTYTINKELGGAVVISCHLFHFG